MEPQNKVQSRQMSSDDGVELAKLIANLAAEWKVILLVTCIGTLLVGFFVGRMPSVYSTSAIISLPTEDNVEEINSGSMIGIDQKGLFKRYYDAARSESRLREYVVESRLLNEMYPNIDESSEAIVMARLLSAFKNTILEPERPKQGIVEYPTRVLFEIESRNENSAVKLLKGYLAHVNETLVHSLKNQSDSIKKIREANLHEEIALLREAAKYKRDLKIQRLEKQNSLTIKKLENEKKLLLELAGKNRRGQLLRIAEARTIAKQLGIENPTPIDDFSSSNSESATNIKVGAQQELPLYLMGTRYLDALTETLKTRNDKEFLTKINEIEKQLEEVRLDPELAALKNRESDDPYIDELPMLINSLQKLKSKSIEYEKVQMFTFDKEPVVTNQRLKPRKALIIISSFIASLFFSVLIAGIRGSLKSRTVSH